MAQRGVSLKSVLTCYEKNKMIFFFIWAVIDFLTINISWFLLNIKQHPSPISRKPQTVLNVWMAWIVCIVLFSYHKCACPMSRAIAATFWPRGRRALRARRPRGPNVKKKINAKQLSSNSCDFFRLNFHMADKAILWTILQLICTNDQRLDFRTVNSIYISRGTFKANIQFPSSTPVALEFGKCLGNFDEKRYIFAIYIDHSEVVKVQNDIDINNALHCFDACL